MLRSRTVSSVRSGAAPRTRRLSVAALAAVALSMCVATSAGAAVPVTKGPWLQRVTASSAVVRVEIEPAGAASLELGAPAGAPAVAQGADGAAASRSGVKTASRDDGTGLHTFVLDGLEPSTRYTYTVRAPGAVKHGAFTTAPRDESDAPFRFLVYGDNRSDDAAHAAVVRAMVPVAADFLVHTGDFVEDGSSDAQWQRFFDIEAPLVRERSLFSALGNHELVDGKGLHYIRYFGEPPPADPTVVAARVPRGEVPEHLNTTFRWASSRFFLLNGMVGWQSGADRAWLENALRAADAEPGLVWRIVVIHHGPWSSGPHGGNRRLHEAQIPELLRAHGVDLVLSGHDHMYERGAASGLAYVVTGGGGAPTYRVKSALPTARKLEAVRHFVEASVTRTAIQLAATRPDGSLIERCGLRKGMGWDCDDAEPAAAGGGAPPPAPRSAAAPAPSSRCACSVVGGRRGGAAGGLLAAIAAAALARVRRVRRVRRRDA